MGSERSGTNYATSLIGKGYNAVQEFTKYVAKYVGRKFDYRENSNLASTLEDSAKSYLEAKEKSDGSWLRPNKFNPAPA